jgi:hypothetical protein
MRKVFFLTAFMLGISLISIGQLIIDNATFTIQSGATVTITGNVTSNVSIQGAGLLQLKGTTLQTVDMGGNTIPNLELDNTSNAVLLNTNTKIGTSLLFTNGKFQTGNLNLILGSAATVTGGSSSNFVWTNGTGQLVKELAADITSFELPVGENSNYRPAYLTTSGSSYSSANFGVRVIGTADANKPPSTASYLNTSWPVTRTGITGGTTTLAGQYVDPTDVTGTEANIYGYYYNNTTTDWSSSGETHNAGTNRISAPITTAAGSLSGINKFVAIGSRAFLQGAYDYTVANTGLMFDNLRTLPFGSSASTANFPSTDPYRVAPYSTTFTHFNNTILETIPNSGVLGAQASTSDNIVDWVFLELRALNASPGNTLLETRSALIQRDGDIVDVDGVSPVTFNNISDGNYILTVRHRNHLGLSIDQTSPRTINEAKSTAFTTNVIDLRTATDPQLFGTSAAFTTVVHPTLGTINLLWGGNANSNNATRFSGLNNDRDYLLITTLGNNPGSSQSNIYHSADLNMNKVVRFSGLSNDRDFLLITVLGNNPGTSKTEAIVN